MSLTLIRLMQDLFEMFEELKFYMTDSCYLKTTGIFQRLDQKENKGSFKIGKYTVTYYVEGIIRWRFAHLLHREDDQPAVIKYDENGHLERQEWWIFDVPHRGGNQPALIWYYENGQCDEQHWLVHGRHHRTGDQPAVIEYDKNGQPRRQEWWYNGCRTKVM